MQGSEVGADALVSLLLVCRDRLAMTQRCIASVRRYTPGNYELVVVDNGSTDGTWAWLQAQSDVVAIRNDSDAGLPQAYNQAVETAQGTQLLLLSIDVVVTPGWLQNLRRCLESSTAIGAVGPVTNMPSYYQTTAAPYTDAAGLESFARSHNHSDEAKWERRLKLGGFCLLTRRDVLTVVGPFDTQFSPATYEDDDFSMRVLLAGFQLMVCGDVFVHRFESAPPTVDSAQLPQVLETNRRAFVDKWGFDPAYSLYIRNEIIQLMDAAVSDQDWNVLELGCACGATLLQIQQLHPQSRLFGIELNDHACAIASTFAEVKAMNAEEPLDYPAQFFDYIILADVLEHLYNPWKVVANLRAHLKPNGKLLVSMPNVMHISVLRAAINGYWTYTDAGLLDRTHIRFFTLSEIDKMFREAGYGSRHFSATTVPLSEQDMEWVRSLYELSALPQDDQFKVYQYLVKVESGRDGGSVTVEE